MSDPLAKLNADLIAKYRLGRELGRGGMATVYLADDLRHRRKVAIKILRPELANFLGPDRFAREIRIAARLNHPHIVPLHDSGEAAGHLYYVMPYVEGESLRHRLERDGPLPVDLALTITRQVASALDYAHSQKLIHRDIKPENILLYQGEAMVTDFGIALPATTGPSERITTGGLALGTPHYMSPEQAAGDANLDGRSDLYSLACVLFELLTGDAPFTGPTAQAVIARRFVDPPPSVRVARPAVSEAIDQGLIRALDREPGRRFPTCVAFAEALSSAAVVTGPVTPSVAVLPFLNLSPDPANDFFADGVTEDVIAQLTRVRSLKVISRSSAMRFKSRDRGFREIGSALGVATLLDGSIRRAGDRVRIVAQLIDAESDHYLWSETYDRELTDIFAIQTDVALQIAAALEAELLPHERARLQREPTHNLVAYQAFLQGRHWHARYTEDSLERGIHYFQQAIKADPNFAMAHVGIATSYAEIAAGQGGGGLNPRQAYERAIEAASRALTLDPELGEAHGVRALLMFSHDFDWTGAEAEFKRALELSPGSADIHDHYGWLCSSQERYDEALALVRRAQELDPLTHRADVASTLLRAGRNEEALEAALKAVEFEPDYGRARTALGWAQIKLGRIDEGIANLEHAVRVTPRHALFVAQLGQGYAVAGREAEARRVLVQLAELAQQRYVSPYHMAYVYTGLGENDRAMDHLEQAYRERAGSVYGIKGSFLFTTLRDNARFQALLGKMNL